MNYRTRIKYTAKHDCMDAYMDVSNRKRREHIFETRMIIQDSRPDPELFFLTPNFFSHGNTPRLRAI